MTTPQLRDLQRRYRFFVQHGGQSVGRQAEIALRLAKAERWADEHDATFIDSPADDADLGDHNYWCAAARRDAAGYDASGHPIRGRYRNCDGHFAVQVELTIDGESEYLGGILDPDANYLRVIRAELADQLRGRLEVDAPDVQLSEN